MFPTLSLTCSFVFNSFLFGRTRTGSPPLSGIHTLKAHFPLFAVSFALSLFNFEIIATFPSYTILPLFALFFISTH